MAPHLMEATSIHRIPDVKAFQNSYRARTSRATQTDVPPSHQRERSTSVLEGTSTQHLPSTPSRLSDSRRSTSNYRPRAIRNKTLPDAHLRGSSASDRPLPRHARTLSTESTKVGPLEASPGSYYAEEYLPKPPTPSLDSRDSRPSLPTSTTSEPPSSPRQSSSLLEPSIYSADGSSQGLSPSLSTSASSQRTATRQSGATASLHESHISRSENRDRRPSLPASTSIHSASTPTERPPRESAANARLLESSTQPPDNRDRRPSLPASPSSPRPVTRQSAASANLAEASARPPDRGDRRPSIPTSTSTPRPLTRQSKTIVSVPKTSTLAPEAQEHRPPASESTSSQRPTARQPQTTTGRPQTLTPAPETEEHRPLLPVSAANQRPASRSSGSRERPAAKRATSSDRPSTRPEAQAETSSSSRPPPAAQAAPARPSLPATRPSQFDTQYVNMLLALDGIPRLHNMLASFFTWILLAGFILFPGTFTSLQNFQGDLNDTEAHILGAVNHVSLFVIAFVCCGIGAAGMCWLWWRWRRNYIWLVNRIFLPGALNSLTGIISTIVNVFGVQHGQFSTTSKVTIIVTAVTALICGVLTALYSFWKLASVKKKHDKEVGKERAGKHGEGLLEKVKRKAGERELEPGVI